MSIVAEALVARHKLKTESCPFECSRQVLLAGSPPVQDLTSPLNAPQ